MMFDVESLSQVASATFAVTADCGISDCDDGQTDCDCDCDCVGDC